MINRIDELTAMESLRNESSLHPSVPIDFSKIRMGAKTISDSILQSGDIQRLRSTNSIYSKKDEVLRAIYRCDLNAMRNISNQFYRISGIYKRLCKYFAYMYKYDWLVTPYCSKTIKSERIIENFNKVLMYLDSFNVKKFLGDAALKVMRQGCYYGYIITYNNKIGVQQLPNKYCRTKHITFNNEPIVEFNMRYFLECFSTQQERNRVLSIFPNDFKKGYELFRKNKLRPDYPGDQSGWYLLNIGSVIKFDLNGQGYPPLMAVIPAIIDLDEAKGLDRKKMMQQLLKIVIQKMPIDKNGDLIFDVVEAGELHNNAVNMLSRAIGIDVLTTFADVEVADLSEDRATTSTDDLLRVQRSLYNQSGTSEMQFNTNGNLALEKSILNDEASILNLIQQFEDFLNLLLKPFNKNSKKEFYRVEILPTTIFNFKELSKLYKENMQVGQSKMLSQIALGQSQSSILATAYFENEILDLVHVLIPPIMSSTMSSNVLEKGNNNSTSQNKTGRPQKSDDEKSTKTIQNKQSMS